MKKTKIHIKENKKLMIILSIILVTVFSISTYHLLNRDKDWKPLTQKIELEYGEQLDLKEDIFIKEEDQTKVKLKTIEFDAKVQTRDEKEYYVLGTHKGNISVEVENEEKSFDFEVIVTDTIAPIPKDFNYTIMIEKGYMGNFKEYFLFDDVDSQIKVVTSVKDFDSNKKGVYQGLVEAVDGSNNKTKKPFEVHVKDNLSHEERTMKLSSDGTINTMMNNNEKNKEIPSNNDAEENTKEKNKVGNEDKTVKTHKDVTSSEVITYTIKRVANAKMLEGEEKVVQQGVNGSIQIVTRIYYTNNIETGREQLSSNVTKSAVEHIIEYGTAKRPTNVVGAFAESPAGLLSYETYTLSGFPNGKEYYQTRDQAIARGENLLDRDMIFSYSHGSDPQGFYVTFRLDY